MPALAAVWSFLLKRPWVIALGALLLLSGGLFLKLQTVKAGLIKSQAQVAVLSAKIEQQNQAVETWRNAASLAAARALASEKKAAQVRVAAQARAARIMTEPVPTGCPEAVRWGAEKGADIGRSWEETP